MPSSTPAHTPARVPRRRARGGAVPSEPFPLRRRDRRRLPFAHELAAPTAALLIGCATAVGVVLRLLVTHGLSLDEIRTVDAARLSFGSLIHHLSHGGKTPPLHPVLQWVVVHVLGDGDLAVRAPSLIAGVALIPATAWLAGELFDRRTAVVAAALTALAPALVWYSQEASGYEFVALFGTLAIVGVVRAIRRGAAVDWALFTVAAALTVWSDWSGLFVVLATEIALAAAAVRRRRGGEPLGDWLPAWGVATFALVCQLAPLAVLAASELQYGGGLTGVTAVGASGVSFYSGVSNVSWALFGFQPGTVTSVLSAVWPLLMLGSLIMVGRGVAPHSALLRVCALVPTVCVFVLGAIASGSFDVRYFLAAVPPVIVLLAHDAMHWPRSNTGRTLAVAALALVFGAALLDEQVNRDNPRRFDYAPAFAEARTASAHGGAVFLLPANLAPVLARFAPGLAAHPLTTQLPSRREARTVTLVTSSFAGQTGATALLNRDLGALRATRRFVAAHSYPGVNVITYR